MNDRSDLDRFVEAQDAGGTYDAAVAQLRAGRKTSHWMWFVFPQVAGLGRSPTAQRFAISGLDEARAYLEHPVLGERLRACASILAQLDTSDPEAIFGSTDAMKLRSSMTLFARAADDPAPFRAILDRFFGGAEDPATLERLS